MTVLAIIGGVLAAAVLFIAAIELYSRLKIHQHDRLSKINHCGKPNTLLAIPIGIPLIIELMQAVVTGDVNKFFYKRVHMFNGAESARVTILGELSFMTVDPANIKAMLATQFKEFGLGSRYVAVHPLLGDGIFSLDGEGWHASRSMLRPQFSREQVSQLETLGVHVGYLISNFKKAGAAGLDAQDQFFRLTIDTATEFLFGESIDQLRNVADSMELDFATAFNYSQKMLFLRNAVPQLALFFLTPYTRRCIRLVHRFVDDYVERALSRANSEEKVILPGHENYAYIFLDELVKQTHDPQVLRDQAINILLAGRDTTAGTLTWCAYYMARDKRIFKKLREAVLADFPPDEPLTFENLKQCVYLRYFVNEILRLYPQVPANFRDALTDTTLPRGGGPNGDEPLFIPKGSSVRYFIYTTHRLKKYWGEDAMEFRPERWEEKRSTGWEYLPFNGGPRICIGQQFALTEISFTLVKILQAFDGVDFVDSGESIPSPPENVGLTLSHLNPVNLKFHPAK